MLMTDTINKVSEIATKKEMTFNEFAGRCLLRGLSYDTARNIWKKTPRSHGYNITTKQIVSEIVGRSVRDLFGDD